MRRRWIGIGLVVLFFCGMVVSARADGGVCNSGDCYQNAVAECKQAVNDQNRFNPGPAPHVGVFAYCRCKDDEDAMVYHWVVSQYKQTGSVALQMLRNRAKSCGGCYSADVAVRIIR